MNTKIKTLLTVLVILSMMTTAVNAGNKGTPILDTVTTSALEIVTYITTIDITSPVGGTIFGTTSVDIGYGTTNTSAQVNYTLNGVYMGSASSSNPFTVTGADDGLTDGGQTNTVIVNVTDPVNGSAQDTVTFKVDITPPGPVTGITSTKGTNYINWTWTPPTNTDFNNVMLTVTQGTTPVFSNIVIPAGTNYFNATGLVPNTEYTMSIQTEDNAPAP